MAFSLPVTPLLAADIIVELESSPDHILLIERKFPPYGWAIPGGFVDVGESLEQAAVREAKEETSLDVSIKQLLGCYSDPKRDKRGHTVSAVFIATSSGTPKAADDAKNLKLWPDNALPDLVFDHKHIIEEYLKFKKTGLLPLFQAY